MPKIVETIEISAGKDRVWSVISDLDREPDYWWGTKSVRNISKEGEVINREITQNFRNHKILQKVILRSKDEIEINYLKGLTEGSKILKIESLGEDKQRLSASWDIRYAGIYKLLGIFISRHVKKGTVDALARIKEACEASSFEKNPLPPDAKS